MSGRYCSHQWLGAAPSTRSNRVIKNQKSLGHMLRWHVMLLSQMNTLDVERTSHRYGIVCGQPHAADATTVPIVAAQRKAQRGNRSQLKT